MDINKHIIDQRIHSIVKQNTEWFSNDRDESRKVSKAFVIQGIASYLGIDLSEAVSLVTEGGNDSGIDAIYVGDAVDWEFMVILFQGKYKRDLANDAHFPANSLLRMVNAVAAVFDPAKTVEANPYLKPKIEEIRSLILDGYVPKVKCVLMNNGLSWANEGDVHIKNAGFPENQVEFEHYNHRDIVNQLKTTERITDTIAMVGRSLVEDFNFKRVLIGKVSAVQLAQLMDKHGDALLERNIRRFLGLRKNRVNESIQETLKSEKMNNFYFFNNGITMVCSKFSHNALAGDNWQVRIEDMQIINGGQTCKTIQQTVKDNPEINFSDAYILLRLYELAMDEHDELLADITIATNSQNPVDMRDLKANENLQRDLEADVKELGYTYKRKRDSALTGDTIPSSVAAEAVCAVWRRKPHMAKFRKNDLFGKLYLSVFENLNSAQLVIAVLIYRFCDSKRKNPKLLDRYPHLSYSSYFMAMLMAQELLSEAGIKDRELTHRNFIEVRDFLESKKEVLYHMANKRLIEALNRHYKEGYEKVELRRLSAAFRRGDLLGYLGN